MKRRAAMLLAVAIATSGPPPGRGADLFEVNPDHWTEGPDGEFHPRKGGGTAWAHRRYGDFVLELEFNVDKGANSGVLFRVAEPGQYIEKGLELQVHDSHGAPGMSKGMCGALYDMIEPATNAVKPAGEWNRYVVTCEGPKIRATLNGAAILDVDLDRWTEPGKNPDGTKNKYKAPCKDKPRAGWLGLQDHGDKAGYRAIRVKPITPPVAPEGAPAPRIEDGWEILFDGKDTEQWRLDPNAWKIREGALVFLGRPRPLMTKAAFGDFSLSFEFLPPKGSSGHNSGGVELRADAQGRGLRWVLGETPMLGGVDKRGCGAVWDCAAPAAKPGVKAGEWNQAKLVCKGGALSAEINGSQVTTLDLEQWTQKGVNPDGSKNPFPVALRDMPRQGRLGFHPPLAYRGIQLSEP